MKIILTKDEAIEKLSEIFPAASIEIETPNINLVQTVMNQGKPQLPMDELINIVRNVHTLNGRLDVSRKIAAIKAVREEAAKHGFYFGLAEAKHFVELF